MAILQFELDPARSELPEGFRIERDSRLHTNPVGDKPAPTIREVEPHTQVVGKRHAPTHPLNQRRTILQIDDGHPAGTLALSAVRALAGLPFAADVGAESRRAGWASAGVHLDELSSLVLCLGLPGDAHTALGRVLALQREAGQPAALTLRQLRCHNEAP